MSMTTAPIHSALPDRGIGALTDQIGKTLEGEAVVTNARPGEAKVTICVPTWKDSADALLCGLARMEGADECTLLVFDDGSLDVDLARQLTRHILRYPGPARLIVAPRNIGRSHARNRLKELAETDWILFLDADMQPDDADFLNRYLKAIEVQQTPALIAGGFSLLHAHPTDENRLHAEQSATSECVTAMVRATDPGRYVFTSNILCHRDILETIEFDRGFKGWGWKDVDWGLRVAAKYPIWHIDNPATHLGLDPDATLIEKYAQSADNFARLVERHPEAMKDTPIFRMAKLSRYLPWRAGFKRIFRATAEMRRLPVRLRVLALKLFRATVYGAEL